MKKLFLNGLCFLCIVLSIAAIIYGVTNRNTNSENTYEDGIERLDDNTLFFKDSGVEVEFSDVLLSSQNEERKLVVSSQSATVSTKLTDKLIQKMDYDILKKTQKVSYTGDVQFVVPLDKLSKKDFVDDKDAHILTILIDHPSVDTVEIDPDKITIGDTKEGFFNRGNIELTVADYTQIESDIHTRIIDKVNTPDNINKASDNALKAVKAIYEPIVKAIDYRYTVEVKFK